MVNVVQLAAPLIFGVLVNYFLFGILTLQLYIYSYSFPGDKISIKLLIYGVYMVELVQVCCAGADTYYWFCSGYGNLGHLDNTYLSPFDNPMLGSIVAFIVQIFFCHRIWKLRTNNWYIMMCAVIGAISVTQLVCGIVGAVKVHSDIHFSAITNNSVFAYMWFVGQAVSDVLIAATMTYLLLGSDAEQWTSTTIVNRATRLMIQSNSLTAGTAVASAIIFAALPGTNYFVATTVVLGKLYSNTLLAAFNHRIFLWWSASGSTSTSSVSRGRAAPFPRSSTRVGSFSETVTENKSYGLPAHLP
jgi:hypothetical protein